MYYECKFTTVGGAYATNKYDLETNDEELIRLLLEDDGYEVLEIYDIKEQI